jgi:hypothetical protein
MSNQGQQEQTLAQANNQNFVETVAGFMQQGPNENEDWGGSFVVGGAGRLTNQSSASPASAKFYRNQMDIASDHYRPPASNDQGIDWGAAFGGQPDLSGGQPLTGADVLDSGKGLLNSAIKTFNGLMQAGATGMLNSPEMVMGAGMSSRVAQTRDEAIAAIPHVGLDRFTYEGGQFGVGSTVEAAADVAQVVAGTYGLVRGGVSLATGLGFSPLGAAQVDAQTVNASVSSGFTTLGVDRSAAKSFLGTPTGNDLLSTLSAADPSASPSIIRARAFDLLATGAELPTAEVLTSPLVKIVPAGQTVTPYSPFFTTRAELTQAAQSGRTMADWFGLPLSSEAPAYSMYEISPTQPAVVFSNRIAPTTEFGGRIQRSGLGLQVLVPNRSLWSQPSLVGTIRN